jgi:hypothetical protein
MSLDPQLAAHAIAAAGDPTGKPAVEFVPARDGS